MRVRGRLVAIAASLAAMASFSASCGSSPNSALPARRPVAPPRTVPVAGAPAASAKYLGYVLSGVGAQLQPPGAPTARPFTSNCHALLDPGFDGRCTIAAGRGGTVAGEVEEEALGDLTQERDLVWRREGDRWSLALVRVANMCRDPSVCSASPGLPTLLWSDDITRSGRPDLIFVMPTDRRGFGEWLDIVDELGQVSLVRYLGDGFADVSPSGQLVTYVPGANEVSPADGFYDQLLIEYWGGRWRLVGEQYIPYSAALAQHQASFRDAVARPAA